MEKLTYRADIDGLRAIAVVAVILYHFGFEAFGGGYVGVDVFFVISGFLITRMIRAQVAAGTFSFSNFYVRRARRLFPALFATIVATLGAAYLLFSPQHLERFGGSILHALFAAANFYFWGESGYFDADAAVKPLLHTWSLGVEEQFYLLWPALLVLLLRRSSRSALVFIAAAGTLSLLLAERWLGSDEAAAFFLLPPRVMELALGAAMVWITDREPRNKLLLEPLVWAGLALIALSVLSYSETTPFPGLTSLVPCVGTALLIYGGRARYSGRILSNRPAVGIGLISYSLYLVHWPLLVFYRYYKLDEPSRLESWVLIAISFAAAALMYRFIENPIRRGIRKERRLSAPVFGLACLALTLIVAAPAAAAWLGGGWAWRLPAEVREAARDLPEKRQSSWQYVEGKAASRDFDPTLTNVLITGDSHAKDFFNAVHLNEHRFEGLEFRHLALRDQCYYLLGDGPPTRDLRRREQAECVEQVRLFESSPLVDAAEYVVVSTRWNALSFGNADAFHRFLEGRGPRLVLLGRTAEFGNVPDLVVRFGRLHGVERFVASRRRTRFDRLNAKLELKARELGVLYLDKLAFLCTRDRTSCDVLDENGDLLFLDYGHWSVEGARHFGGKMAEMGFLADLRPRTGAAGPAAASPPG